MDKRILLPIVMAIAMLTWNAHGIGLQHGLFQSQATQGPEWRGTAVIRSEKFTITVYPDYLDVELDWEFEVGGEKPAQHTDALEIVGNINFEQNSVVTGMLVWYKDKILKGKLKTTAHARKEYEEVVDRNSPVPPKPRDPVLLEMIREDNYDISIFPVEWGGTRKVRIRYQVPAAGGTVGYPHAFTENARVVIQSGRGIDGFALQTTSGTIRYDGSATRELPGEDFSFLPYSSGSTNPIPMAIIPIPKEAPPGSRIYVGGFTGKFSGWMANICFRTPPQLLAGEPIPARAEVDALIRAGSDSCRKGVNPVRRSTGDTLWNDALRIYSKEPLVEKIHWRMKVDGEVMREYVETPQVIRLQDGLQYARTFGEAPFYPMAATMPRSLGVNLGFIDKWYSLVALESDAMSASAAAAYAQQGVPSLLPGDIFPDTGEAYDVPLAQWLQERQIFLGNLLRPSYSPWNNGPVTVLFGALPAGIRYFLKDGWLHVEIDPALFAGGQALECAVHSLDGKLLKAWTREELRTGTLSWAPDGASASGVYLLGVRVGQKRYSQAFHFRR